MHDVAPGARAHGGPRTTRDAPVPPPGSGVSFVLPVLNEERYLRNAVESVMQQEVDGPAELVLALGPSTDATDAIARELAAADARIRLIPNPAADIPVALNLAIAASRYPTIVRVDAHSALEPGYVRRAMATLLLARAANVGGVMKADGRTPFQRAVARAYNSRIGLGGGAYHSGGAAGPVLESGRNREECRTSLAPSIDKAEGAPTASGRPVVPRFSCICFAPAS